MPQNDFSPNQFRSMQEDALMRVREMQRRSQERLRQSNMNMMNANAPNSGQASNLGTDNSSHEQNYASTPKTDDSAQRNNNLSGANNRGAQNSAQQSTNNSGQQRRNHYNSAPNNFNNARQHSAADVNRASTKESADSTRDPASALNLIPESIFAQFNIDKETGIILLLIFLLVKEKADTPIILALCYLLI